MSLFRFLSLAAFAAALAAQTGRIELEVRDPSGAPVAATGRAVDLNTGAARWFEATAGGRVELSGLPYGAYRIEISNPGFATRTVEVSLDSAAAVVPPITLRVRNSAFRVDVVGSTPLRSFGRAIEEVPSPIQGATEADWLGAGIPSVPDFLNQRLNGVYWNEVQGNPFQPDINYRGYTASPLLGTPQGLSIYMDGVRLNQPFGDVVSWDLIPRIAIADMTLVPGSDPLYGLNTLGGALSVTTKNGADHAQTVLQLGGGSFARKTADFEHGGWSPNGLDWYAAASFFFEDGWREDSPSNVRQFFGRLGYRRERTTARLTAAFANNALIGNGLQEQQFLARQYNSVYTKPDFNGNRSPFLNLSLQHAASANVLLTGNVYYRYIGTRTLNGDINEESLDQSLYQPNAAERAALAAAGYTGFPAAGENALNTPFPYWRCIANVLLRDEPGEKCNGLINRSVATQQNYGGFGQASWFGRINGLRNQLIVGAGHDRSNARFTQSTQIGYLAPDRGVIGLPAFADGVSGGDMDGEPFDNRVNLRGHIHTSSLYATDTISMANRTHVTVSARYNRTAIDNLDRLNPAPGTGSLTGRHSFQRLNPAAGLTTRAFGAATAYFNYAEGSRAPTAIELGCADPEAPCRLPNALAGDPPLTQVVTRTVEAGVRSSNEGRLTWSAGWFRSANRDDILFVASQQTGYGYFRNFGRTRRQGIQLDLGARLRKLQWGGGYTLLDATFQSSEFVNGESNSEGDDPIEPGARIPMIPRHMFKSFAQWEPIGRLSLNVSMTAISSSYARGNENNLHEPDGRYFLGSPVSPGYAVVNAGARLWLHRNVELTLRADNLFNRRYYTGAQLGPTGFTPEGNFIARPFGLVDGEYPVRHVSFYAPGAPRSAWAGLRFRF